VLHEVAAGSPVLTEQDETSPEKKRLQQCVTAKISDRPKVEDKGKRVISPTFYPRKSEKCLK